MFPRASDTEAPRLNERLRDAAASGGTGLAPWGLLLLAALLGGTGDPKRAAASPSVGSVDRAKVIATAPSAQKKILPTTQCGFSGGSEASKTAISYEEFSRNASAYGLDRKTQLNKLS
jgi:hypothetical protein